MTDNRSDGLSEIAEAGITETPGSEDLLAPGAAGGIAAVDVDADDSEGDYVDPELKRGRNLAVLALGTSQAIDNTEGGVVNTVFPLLIEAFGIGRGDLGIISSISKFARGILGPIWAILADRFGKKIILFLVTGVWGLWTMATGFAQNYTQFLILYSIAVCGTVASEPILNGLMGDLFGRSERGRAFGLVRGIGTGAGMVLTPAIALYGSEGFGTDGWRYAMWTMGGLSLLSGLLILMWVKEPGRSKKKVSDDPDSGVFKLSDGFKLFKIPTVLLIALMLPLVTSMVLFAFMQTFWVQVNGFTVPEAGFLFVAFSAGSVIGSILGGLSADVMVRKFGHKGRIMMMQIYLLAFAAVTFLAFYFNWGTGIIYWVIIFLVGLIFPIGFSACVLPMVSTVVPTQLNATGFAMLFSLVQGIITAIMTILVGFLAEAEVFGVDPAVRFQNVIAIFVSGAYALNAVYWFVFYKAYPKDVARQRERTAQVAAGTF